MLEIRSKELENGLHQVEFDIGIYPIRAVGSYHMVGKRYPTENLCGRSESLFNWLLREYTEEMRIIDEASDPINVFCAHGILNYPGWEYKVSKEEMRNVKAMTECFDGSLIIDCCNPTSETLPAEGPLILYPMGFVTWRMSGNLETIPDGDFVLNK